MSKCTKNEVDSVDAQKMNDFIKILQFAIFVKIICIICF